ncbi:auxin efflux carrier [Saccharospirillum sp. MSK14-1]|uniref:AEC family transporter n=1 Tax=Saccharospirillum sp. MSK14-1 TaxID=1897632 RepID=UPI000D36299F|nr:AEC family transporter [Saccharospirillum sp. MSK14-1]PTY37504.1 auxin efflux carrier [Saccharospirillum sp. MSK14-1]
MIATYLNALFPVVFCAALGWLLAKRTTLLSAPGLSQLVTQIGLPALILNALLTMEAPLAEVSTTAVAIVLVLAVTAILGAVILTLSGLSVRGYLSMLVNPNTGNLGIPLVFALLGQDALVHAVVISTVVQISHFTLGTWLLSGRFTLKSALSNASVMALMVGGIWHLSELPTPAAMIRTLDLLAGMTIPVMLLLLGRSLAGIDLREWRRLGRIFGLSLVRVALGVSAAATVIWALPLAPVVAQTLMIQASMPVAVISYILASHYDGPKDDIAAVTLISIPLSLLAVMALMQWAPVFA